MATLPSKEDIDVMGELLQPYFLALGKVAHSWNHLHEEIGKLFCIVAGLENDLGMSIWHALKSDRSQRDILQAASIRRSDDEYWNAQFPKARDDIGWLLTRTNDIANKRNDAIHAPCYPNIWKTDFEITPYILSQNPRAKSLIGKHILSEFEWYQRSADTLKGYAISCQFALSDRRRPWPDTPRMPTLGERPPD